MHRVIEDNLEAYLGGVLHPEENRRVEDHLASCELCRHVVTDMREHAVLLRVLRPLEFVDIDPSPGFYARVMDRIESQKTLSIWSALVEPVFSKRLAVATFALLLLLSAMVVAVRRGPAIVSDGEEDVKRIVVTAEPPNFGIDQQRDRGVVFGELVTYSQDAAPAGYQLNQLEPSEY